MITKINLGEQEKDVIELAIHGEQFYVPVGKSLTLGEATMLGMGGEMSPANIFEFFRKYIRPEVMDSLTIEEFELMVKEWSAATLKPKNTGDPSLGEC